MSDSLWIETQDQTRKAHKLLKRDDCVTFWTEIEKEGFTLPVQYVYSTFPDEKVLDRIKSKFPLAQIEFTDLINILKLRDKHDSEIMERCLAALSGKKENKND